MRECGRLLSLTCLLAACGPLAAEEAGADTTGASESTGGSESTGASEHEETGCEVLGAKSCEQGNAFVELTCIEGDEGGNVLEQSPCEEGEECVAGLGCTACVDVCAEGEVRCSVDPPNFVVSCERASPAGCATLVPAFDCTTAGLSTCVPPDEPVGELQEYCVNECGARNVPLDHSVCDPHDTIGCAVWVCDPLTQTLVPDHTACSQGGAPCEEDSDCVSCSCQAGICIGNDVNSCNDACV